MSWELRPGDRRAITPGRRCLVSGSRSLAALGGVLLLGGCSGQDLALLEPASDRAEYVSQLWLGSWIAAGFVGVFVFALIVWAVLRYRRRSDDEIPAQVRYHLPIEVLYTVAPIIMVLVFFYHTVESDEQISAAPSASEPADHEILVLGEKWSWSFNYIKEEATGGRSVYTVGTPADRPTLVLPVGETIQFRLQSQDVIHAFWVPAFLFKMDVIPGRENSFTLTPTREGEFAGRCSELCGIYHSRMLFTVQVVSREEFDIQLQELQDAGNVGVVKGADITRDIVGEEPEEGAAQ